MRSTLALSLSARAPRSSASSMAPTMAPTSPLTRACAPLTPLVSQVARLTVKRQPDRQSARAGHRLCARRRGERGRECAVPVRHSRVRLFPWQLVHSPAFPTRRGRRLSVARPAGQSRLLWVQLDCRRGRHVPARRVPARGVRAQQPTSHLGLCYDLRHIGLCLYASAGRGDAPERADERQARLASERPRLHAARRRVSHVSRLCAGRTRETQGWPPAHGDLRAVL